MTAPDQNVKVALVEDTPETREALAVLINGSPGFTCVAVCASAEEALRAVPATHPDVVLMDIHLPGMSGIECLKPLKAQLPDAQMIMLTVFEDAERIFQSLTAGATGYITKKTPPAKLLEAITDAHQGGSPMSSQIARQVVEAFRQPPAQPGADAKLSPRESQVLKLLAQGFLYKEIADKLDLSIGTIRVYIRKIYGKLHVHTRTEAMLKAFPHPRSTVG